MSEQEWRKRPRLVPADKVEKLFKPVSKKPWPTSNRTVDKRLTDKALATQCVHAGERAKKPDFWSASTPIYSSNTFWYDKAIVGHEWSRERAGYGYARSGSPTEAVLAQALATLENAEVVVTTSSGMAAVHLATVTAPRTKEDKLLFSEDVYGSVYDLLDITLPELGAQVEHEDFTDLNRLEDTLKRERPQIVCFEVITNPLCKVIDAPVVIELAHRYGAKVVLDNTWTTPYLLHPFSLGADWVVHSLSKFIAGHGDVLGGAVMCYAEKEVIDRLFFNRMKLGPTLGIFEAWLILRGLKTFELRFPRQCENALKLAQFLEQHPLVARVDYPGLPSHPHHEIAKRIFDHGAYGAMMRFDVADCDYEKASRFRSSTRVAQPAGTLGDIFTEINYIPAVPRLWRYTDETQAAMDINPGTMRMSVGIEDVNDLMADLDQALHACQ